MAKSVEIKAGQKLKIFSRSFSSIPIEYQFQARAIDGSEPDGQIKISRRQLVFPAVVETIPLQKDNIIKAGYWDTFVSAYVTANQDLIIEDTSKNFSVNWLILIALVVIIFVATLVLIISS